MATRVYRLTDVMNPSSGHQAFTGGSNVLPPSSGAYPSSEVEFSTIGYSNASSSNDVRVSVQTAVYAYACIRVRFQLAGINALDVTDITVQAEANGNDGNSIGGWRLYLRRWFGSSWGFGVQTTSFSDVTLTSTYASGGNPVDHYIDNGYVDCLLITRSAFDSNGDYCELNLDDIYFTVEYTPRTYPRKGLQQSA